MGGEKRQYITRQRANDKGGGDSLASTGIPSLDLAGRLGKVHSNENKRFPQDRPALRRRIGEPDFLVTIFRIPFFHPGSFLGGVSRRSRGPLRRAWRLGRKKTHA